jgi:hypothetical protein
VTPHKYAIAAYSRHYLKKAVDWYGPYQDVYRHILCSIKPSYYWPVFNNWNKELTKMAIIVYPLQEQSDYYIINPEGKGKLTFNGESLLLVKKATCKKAIDSANDDLKFRCGKNLLGQLQVKQELRPTKVDHTPVSRSGDLAAWVRFDVRAQVRIGDRASGTDVGFVLKWWQHRTWTRVLAICLNLRRQPPAYIIGDTLSQQTT